MAGQLHEWNTCVYFFSFLKILVNILSSNSKSKSLNLDKMDKFLKRYNHPRLNQKETEENMNRQVIGNETELIILKHQHNKSPRPYCFTGKFWNYSKELQRKEHIWTHFMRPPSPWYQNQKKRYHKKDYQALSWMNIDAKNPQHNTSRVTPTIHWNNTPWSNGTYSRDVRFIEYRQINQCDPPY